jgi:hypothetical protein
MAIAVAPDAPGEVMTPWLFSSQQWPWTIRRTVVFVDQQLGDAIDMP